MLKQYSCVRNDWFKTAPKIVSSKMIFLTVLLWKIYLQFDIKVHDNKKQGGNFISINYFLAKSKISKSQLRSFLFFFSRLNYFSNWLIQIHFKEKEKQLLCMHYVPQIIWATTKQGLENLELDKSVSAPTVSNTLIRNITSIHPRAWENASEIILLMIGYRGGSVRFVSACCDWLVIRQPNWNLPYMAQCENVCF